MIAWLFRISSGGRCPAREYWSDQPSSRRVRVASTRLAHRGTRMPATSCSTRSSTEPGAVLNRVDQLVAGMRAPRCASLVLATLTRRDDGWSLQYSRAGHLPPLLIRNNQAIMLDGAGGSLIGFGKGGRSAASAELTPDDVLVLYTDGLIERRNRTLRDGLATLAEVGAASTSADAAGVGEEMLSRLAAPTSASVARPSRRVR